MNFFLSKPGRRIVERRPKLMKYELTFTRWKETKGTWRYIEDERKGQLLILGQIYIKKFALPREAPEQLRLTVESTTGE